MRIKEKLVDSPFDFQQDQGEKVSVRLSSCHGFIPGTQKPAKKKSKGFGVHVSGPDDLQIEVHCLTFAEATALFDAVQDPLTDQCLARFKEGVVPGAFNNGWPCRFS